VKKRRQLAPDDAENEVATLVRTLHVTEQRLKELTAGEVDAVMGPAGQPLMLRQAQERLLESETTLRELATTQAAILNSLPARIAVLDPAGIIVAVNDRWRDFASANALKSPHYGVRLSYLEICDRAQGNFADESRRVAAGIRSVLNGATKEFTLIYPCHAPTEERWFQIIATPMGDGRPNGVVIAHINITEQRRAEESVRFQAQLLDHIGESVIATDMANQRLIYANRFAAELFGRTPEEMIVLHPSELRASLPDDQQLNEILKCAKEGSTWRGEQLYRRKDGGTFPVLVTAAPVVDANGVAVGIVSSATDISERNRIENELRLNRDRLARVHRLGRIGFVEVDLATQETLWSEDLYRLFGLDAGSTVRDLDTFLALVHTDDRDRLRAASLKARRGEETTTDEFRIVKPDGEIIWLYSRRELVRDTGGRPTTIVSTIFDITEVKRKDEVLLQTQTLLSGIVESSEYAIISVSVDGLVTTWNKSAESIFGYSPGEIVGQPDLSLCVPGREYEAENIRNCTARGERVARHEAQRRRKDGSVVDLSLAVSPIFDALERVVGSSEIMLDISAAKRTEAALRRQEELYRATYQQASVGIALIDREFRYVHVNNLMADSNGLITSEMVGRMVVDVVPDIWEAVEPVMRRVLESGEPVFNLEVTGRKATKSGKTRHELISYQPIRLFGEMVGISIMTVDITERRTAEEALRQSQEHLAEAQRVGQIGSIEVDLRSKAIYWSKEVYRLHELEPTIAGPLSLSEAVNATHPDDRPAFLRFSETLDGGKVPEPFESRIPLRDGRVRWVRRSAEVLRDDSGVPATLLITVQDISDLKRAEFAERALFARTRTLVEQAPTLIAMFDRGMNYLAASQLWVAEYGGGRNDLTGLNHYDVLSKFPEEWRVFNARALAGETIRNEHDNWIRADGTVRWMRSVVQPWTDADGTIGGIIIAEDDFTDRKLAEDALRRSQDHLARVQRVARIGSIEVDLASGKSIWSEDLFLLLGIDSKSSEPGIDVFANVVHSEDRDMVRDLNARGRQGKITEPSEFRIVRSDGTVRWLYHISAILDDANGQPIQRVVTIYDITERKCAEIALLRSKEHLARVQRVGQIGSSEVDLHTQESIWSDELYILLGLEPKPVPHSLEEFLASVHRDDRGWMRESSLKSREGEDTEPVEFRVVRPDGTIRWLYSRREIVRDFDGKPAAAVSTLIDITERKVAMDELRQSREYLATVQRVARIGSNVVDIANQKENWSPEFRELIGVDPGITEPNLASFVAALHPDDRTMMRGLSQRARRGEDVEPVEFRVVWPDGSIRWLYRQIAFIRDASGRPTLLISTILDITDRKASMEALRLSEEHLSLVQRVARIGSSVRDLAAQQETWSDEFRHLVGIESKAIEPSFDVFVSHVHPDDREIMRNSNLRARRGEETEPTEFRIVNAGGSIRWLYRQRAFVSDAEGRRTHMISTITDVTDRKLSEAARRELEQKYWMTFDFAPIGIAHVSGDGTYLLVNDTFCTMLGASREEVLGANYRAFTHTDDLERSDIVVARLSEETSAQMTVEKRFNRRDGRVVWCEVTSKRDPNAASGTVRFISTFRDITERKDAEERQNALESQLQQSQKMEAVGRLTGGVAHDFNNLLTVVLINLELVRERVESDPKMVRQIDSALGAGRRGADLTQRLLAFSRRQALEPKTVDVNLRISELISLLEKALGETIKIKQRVGTDLWKATVDPSQFDSAIMNLAINARDAMPDGGILEINTENVVVDEVYAIQRPGLSTGPYIRVSVTDTGMGMSPETIEKAFEPFFTTKAVGKGSGLGLSMVYGFVKQSGGHVSIYSEVDVGTTIALLLPLAPDQSVINFAAPDVRRTGGNERILVVEDDVDVRLAAVLLLNALGYRTLEAGTASEAFNVFADNPDIDLVMSDVILPGGEDGAGFARRAQALRPSIKVLFMSGYTDDVLTHDGRLDAGTMLLHKPFTRDQLAEKVRSAIERPNQFGTN
jgi:PAS domain S-box-containing protein